jgi:CelD/BcsL family acetyltransferase involved in cellulose biosynthesis
MKIVRFHTFEELQPYCQAWDHLAASVPFRSWTWLSTWWKHYRDELDAWRASRELFVLAVFDGEALVGVAPWFIQSTAANGTRIRTLGSGEICSDYMTLLCRPGAEREVTEMIAEYLMDILSEACPEHCRWNQLELFGVDRNDYPTTMLSESLHRRHCTIHRRSRVNCWRIDLPTDWEQYLAGLSSNFRQEARRLDRRYFGAGKAVLRNIEKSSDLSPRLDMLVDLHQRRWRAHGEPGCYASPRFAGFIREISPLLFERGEMQVQWLEIDGRPVAAEYELLGGGVVYIYQTGIDPEAKAHQPGKLANLAGIRRAIDGGRVAYDFLRGDEAYKAHLRATPRPNMEIRIIPNCPVARLRHHLWLTGTRVKRWLNKGRTLAGTPIP